MAKVQLLRTGDQPGDADPLRAMLAIVIQEAGKARSAVEGQRRAIERIQSEVFAGAEKIEAAEKNITKAQQRHAAAIVGAATSAASSMPASGVGAARRALADLQDELEANKTALEQLKADLEHVETDALKAEVAVDAAISDIFAPIAAKLITRGQEISAQLAPIKGALSALWSEPTGQVGAWMPSEQRPLAELKTTIGAFLKSSASLERSDVWRDARSKLRADANAELVELMALLSDKTVG